MCDLTPCVQVVRILVLSASKKSNSILHSVGLVRHHMYHNQQPDQTTDGAHAVIGNPRFPTSSAPACSSFTVVGFETSRGLEVVVSSKSSPISSIRFSRCPRNDDPQKNHEAHHRHQTTSSE